MAFKKVGAYPRVRKAKQENKFIHRGGFFVLFCFVLEVGGVAKGKREY